MKYLIGIIIGVVAFSGATAYAISTGIEYRVLQIPNDGDANWTKNIIRFVDPDNGNVCYYVPKCGNACGSISCLKP